MTKRFLISKSAPAVFFAVVFAFALAACNIVNAQQAAPRPQAATAAVTPRATATAAATATGAKPAAEAKKEKTAPVKRDSGDVVPSDIRTREDFLRDQPNIPKRGGPSIWRFLGSLVFISFLIVVTIFVLKQIYARGMRLDLKGRHIKVMDVVQLGTGRAVFLVRVGNKALLLGTADKGLNYLADVTESVDLEAADEAASEPAQPFNFRRSLNEAFGVRGKKDSETVSPAQFNSRLKDRLSKLEEDEKDKT